MIGEKKDGRGKIKQNCMAKECEENETIPHMVNIIQPYRFE
jgi:hypothetical protein